jgi:pseudaminic acid biosynthesis-associated methylase
MNLFETEQEDFWAGEFGDGYIERNESNNLLAANLVLFSRIFTNLQAIHSLLELGANIGMNLIAIKQLLPDSQLSAVEINEKAVEYLKKWNHAQVYHQSILDFMPDTQRDFVFTKGVLIHINPDSLDKVYEKLYQSSKRYICLIEYYNPTPVEVEYRGHKAKLFKRDFAGEMMDEYKDLRLVDYGFVYHREHNFPQDDLTWFLLEKAGNELG